MIKLNINTDDLKSSKRNLLACMQPIGMDTGTNIGGLNILEFISETQIFLNANPDKIQLDGNDYRSLVTLHAILKSNDCSLEDAANLSVDLAEDDEVHDELECEENPCDYCNLWTVLDQCALHAIILQTSAFSDDRSLMKEISGEFRNELNSHEPSIMEIHCIRCNQIRDVECSVNLESGSRFTHGDEITIVRIQGVCACGQINSRYLGSFIN